jgi:hypothetical protein
VREAVETASVILDALAPGWKPGVNERPLGECETSRLSVSCRDANPQKTFACETRFEAAPALLLAIFLHPGDFPKRQTEFEASW